MRTTVTIDDHLLAEAKAVAASSHRTLGEVIDDALRVSLAQRPTDPSKSPRVKLPTHGGSGLRPGVDLEDKEHMAELLGDNEAMDAAS